MTDGDLHLYLVTDDHLEHVLTYNWGMTTRIVTGSASADSVDPSVVDLVGDRPALREIAAHVPGADVEALLAAQDLNGDHAITAVVKALAPVSYTHLQAAAQDASPASQQEVIFLKGPSNGGALRHISRNACAEYVAVLPQRSGTPRKALS